MKELQRVNLWIDDEGGLHLENIHTGVVSLLPFAFPGNGGNGGGNGLKLPDFKTFPLTWKQKGTSNHPTIGNGDMQLRAFVLGHFCHIEGKVHFGSSTFLGGGTDATHCWYFQLPAILMPDFKDPNTLETPGSFHAYTAGGVFMMDGTCYWSKNVGSGIDGIKLSASKDKDIGPRTIAWTLKSSDGLPDGDSLRFAISYRRASDLVALDLV